MKTLICNVIVLCLSLTLIGCGGIALPPNSDAFYLVEKPDERVKNQLKYFNKEYQQISDRRKHKLLDTGNNEKPEHLIGLGLSGGGIRSSAYQLGLLAGLQSKNQTSLSFSNTSIKPITPLDKVDYLSCVSGGCWATGAYLIANETDDNFFGCLTEYASTGKECGRAKNVLRNTQNIELIDKDEKEKWELDIRNAYFPNKCREFKFSDRTDSCRDKFINKPNVIFNATHSTLSPTKYGSHLSNLPFQITPDQLGTIVDCGSKGLDKDKECGFVKGFFEGDKVGFFVQQNAEEFEWHRRERPLNKLLVLQTSSGTEMSKAMAHSSAVVGSASKLSFSMGLTYNDEYAEDKIRDNYLLTDGGFSENLGLLALIERGVDLIVLSDIGYPDQDNEKADLELAAKQVKKLLHCDVNATDIEKVRHENLVSALTYSCPNANGKKPKEGKILYVRPYPNTIGNFKQYLNKQKLNEKDLSDLIECINEDTYGCYGEKPKGLGTVNKKDKMEDKYRFPQTDTMLTSYDAKLIRAYYLLGKYIAEHHIASEILKNNSVISND